MFRPLRTRTIWPIVALTTCALAVPAGAQAKPKHGPPEHAGPKPKAAEPKAAKPQPATPARGKSQPRGNAYGHRGTPVRKRTGWTRRASSSRPAETRPKSSGSKQGRKAPKVTICHATGSETNPYVQITISRNGLNGHARHHDGADIIPAPSGGCPTQAAGQSTPAPAAGATAAARPDGGRGNETARGGVAGVRTDSGARPVAATDTSPVTATARVGGQDARDRGGSLPFTGFGLTVLAALGLAALVSGVRLHRAQS